MLNKTLRYALDRVSGQALQYGLGKSLFNSQSQWSGRYRFSEQGGAVGTLNILDAYGDPEDDGSGVGIPLTFALNHSVVAAYLHVYEALTSAGGLATVEFSIAAAGDVAPATLATNFPVGLNQLIPIVYTTTDSSNLTLTIGATPLTGGSFDIFLLGFMPVDYTGGV